MLNDDRVPIDDPRYHPVGDSASDGLIRRRAWTLEQRARGIPVSERNSGVRASFRAADDHDGGGIPVSGGGIPVSEGGIPVSEHLFARRTTTTARLTDDGEAMGNDLDSVLCTEGPTTAHRRPHAIQLLGRLFPTDLPSPAGPKFRLSATELLPFRERVQDGIGMPGAMAAVARPGILAQIGHHRGPHWVGLDVPQNDEQVVAALGKRKAKRKAGESGTKRDKAGQVRYWQYGHAEKSPDLAILDLSRFPALLDLSRFPASIGPVPLPRFLAILTCPASSSARFLVLSRFLVDMPI